MLSRITLAVLFLFWLVMSVLLWRAELRGGPERGTAVPADRIWQKILTAPDNSTLEVRQHGKKIGFCRWAANAGEEITTGKVSSDEFAPEGMIKRLAGYTIDVDGTFRIKNFTNNVRVDFSLKLSTNHVWQEIVLRLNLRPFEVEIRASNPEKMMRLKAADEHGRWERALSFSDLRNPELAFQEIGHPVFVALAGLVSQLPTGKQSGDAFRLPWRGSSEWLEIGPTRLRAYRLHTRLMNQYPVTLYVSRVGELLRVELPNEIVLVNDGLTGLYSGRR